MAEKTIEDHIEETAAGAAQVVIDGQDTTAQPIPHLIAADRHLARKTAAASTALPLRYGKIRPGGSI